MRAVVNAVVGHGLPNNVPFQAKRPLILQSTQSSAQLSLDCLEHVRPLVNAHADQLIEKHFGRYTQGSLRGVVSTLVAEKIDLLIGNAQEHIK